MSKNIFDYPPSERKYVAVRRFILINGKDIFEKLLKHLDLTREEFTNEYGEQLIGNPTMFNKEIVGIIKSGFKGSVGGRKQ
ncbi:MAG: hypothetical protein IJ743_04515 [Bacilli bacterium]|nr:hypothetical protein [Bacilli bacterium]